MLEMWGSEKNFPESEIIHNKSFSQYPAILTARLVNNTYLYNIQLLFWILILTWCKLSSEKSSNEWVERGLRPPFFQMRQNIAITPVILMSKGTLSIRFGVIIRENFLNHWTIWTITYTNFVTVHVWTNVQSKNRKMFSLRCLVWNLRCFVLYSGFFSLDKRNSLSL